MPRLFPFAAALILAVPCLAVPQAQAQISIGFDIRIGYAPPPLPPPPEQPPLPGPDYMWVPGYWAWSDWIDDYYWVDGYWEAPPSPGLYWTPAWWGWEDGAFRFHDGYWGPTIGFYGGVNYGFGYTGHGWQGGYWDHGHVFYNSAVFHVTNVRNVYRTTVIVNNPSRASFNGGAGGIAARPTSTELEAARAPHIAPTPRQQQHVQTAQNNPHAAARALNPAWHPPAVHRVSPSGTPISREQALAAHPATPGAQRPAGGPAPARMQSERNQARPAPGQSRVEPGETRAEPVQPRPEPVETRPEPAQPRPAQVGRPEQGWTPPAQRASERPVEVRRPVVQAPPQPKPAPARVAPPPQPAPPRPAAPKPAPKKAPEEHEHRE